MGDEFRSLVVPQTGVPLGYTRLSSYAFIMGGNAPENVFTGIQYVVTMIRIENKKFGAPGIQTLQYGVKELSTYFTVAEAEDYQEWSKETKSTVKNLSDSEKERLDLSEDRHKNVTDDATKTTNVQAGASTAPPADAGRDVDTSYAVPELPDIRAPARGTVLKSKDANESEKAFTVDNGAHYQLLLIVDSHVEPMMVPICRYTVATREDYEAWSETTIANIRSEKKKMGVPDEEMRDRIPQRRGTYIPRADTPARGTVLKYIGKPGLKRLAAEDAKRFKDCAFIVDYAVKCNLKCIDMNGEVVVVEGQVDIKNYDVATHKDYEAAAWSPETKASLRELLSRKYRVPDEMKRLGVPLERRRLGWKPSHDMQRRREGFHHLFNQSIQENQEP